MSSIMKQEPKSTFSLAPKSIEEAEKFAEIFCKSELCPKHLKGKPGDVLMTMQMGYEYGLQPLQAIKTIGVINGIPFVYGDGKLGLIMKSHFFEDIREWFDEKNPNNIIAYCTVKRKGREETTRCFSMSDAKTAGLSSKTGPWQQYPKRMLQHRARGLALSDTFPDVLFGLVDEEEAKEISTQQPKDITPITKKGNEGLKEALRIPLKQSETIPVMINSEPEPVDSHIEESIDKETGEVFFPPELATKQQLDDLQDLISQHGFSEVSTNKWLSRAKVVAFEEMTKESMQSLIDGIIKQVAKG